MRSYARCRITVLLIARRLSRVRPIASVRRVQIHVWSDGNDGVRIQRRMRGEVVLLDVFETRRLSKLWHLIQFAHVPRQVFVLMYKLFIRLKGTPRTPRRT